MIDAEKANYTIAWMCRLLGVPRSSFYAWRNRAETATAARRRELAVQVRRVFEAGRGAYGCRRVAAQLNRDGHPCSVGLVADLMRELGLRAVPAAGLQAHHRARRAAGGQPGPDRPGLHRRPRPASAWSATSPTCKTGEGWLYLATVIDLATRMVDRLAARQPHAHQPGHRRPGDGHHATATSQPDAVFHSDRGTNTPRPSSPGSARPTASAPASAGPGCAGTTPPPRASSPR